MSSAEHLLKLEEWTAEQEDVPCSCGGKMVTGWTVPRLVPGKDGLVWETIVHANCVLCGCGECKAVVTADDVDEEAVITEVGVT